MSNITQYIFTLITEVENVFHRKQENFPFYYFLSPFKILITKFLL